MDINAQMVLATGQMIDTIGTSAIYNSLSVTIIFDNAYQSLDMDSGQVMSTEPRAFGKSSDFANAAQGDLITISDVDYEITTPEPDGSGGVLMRLKRS